MADDEAGGVLPVFDPDAVSGPRRATFKPLDPVPIGEDGTPEFPPLPPWLSAPAPDPTSAQLADAPPPVGVAATDVPPPSAAGEPVSEAPPAASVFAEPTIAPWIAPEPDPSTDRVMDADELGGALEATLSTGGTLAALEQFEQQLRLRGVDVPVTEAIEIPPAPEPVIVAATTASGSWTLVDEVDAIQTGAIELETIDVEPAPAPAASAPVASSPPELIEPDPFDSRIDLSGFGFLAAPAAMAADAPVDVDVDPRPGSAPHGADAPPTDTDTPAALDAFAALLVATAAAPAIEDPAPELPVARPAAQGVAAEQGGLAPTPDDLRVGRAARMFWLWFPVNASLVVAALGAALLPVDGSLRQAILAALIGVALAFIPIGFATMIAKRSGQPTMVASRAVFGHRGNILPSLIALATRVLLAGALVWFAALGVSGAIAPDAGPGDAVRWLVLAGVLAVVVAAALLGARVIAVVQLVLTILSAITLVGFIALTAGRLDLAGALQRQDGPWIPVLGGAVLVLSVVGLAWAMSGGDLARYQRSSTGSTGSMLWATIGATLPAFLLIAYGAMLAASDPDLGAAIFDDPVGAIAGLLPAWAVLPATLAIGGALASGAIIALYSAGLAVLAAGVNAGRPAATTIATVAVVATASAFTVGAVDGAMAGFVAVLPVAVVPVAVWTGIIAGDTMVRTRPIGVDALLHRGGAVPDVVWTAVLGLVALTALGWGLVDGAPFTGWLFPLLGGSGDAIAAADLGVLVALVLAIPLGVIVGLRSGRGADRTTEASATAVVPE